MTPARRDADLVLRQGGWSSFEDWRAEAPRIRRLANGFQWAVAKWVLWGEGRYGERYAQAVHETGLAEQTVLNILSVYRAFPDSRQREALSWSHHAALTALPAAEQDRLLDLAEKEALSVTALRREAAGARPHPSVRGFASSTNDAGPLDAPADPPHLDVGSLVDLGEQGRCRVTYIGHGKASVLVNCVRVPTEETP
jgi:hypothetical protein